VFVSLFALPGAWSGLIAEPSIREPQDGRPIYANLNGTIALENDRPIDIVAGWKDGLLALVKDPRPDPRFQRLSHQMHLDGRDSMTRHRWPSPPKREDVR
jgi:hypothetical protein